MALKLWSKLENAGDVTSPQLGTGGSEDGSPTYPPARFGNGILSDINNEGCRFPTIANSIDNIKGTIEIWAKVLFAPTHSDLHFLWEFRGGTQAGIQFLFSSSIDKFQAGSIINESSQTSVDSGDFTWSSGDLVHFGVTWDREGNDIGGSKTLALYVNNIEKGSSTTGWAAGTPPNYLYVGEWNSNLFHSDAVIDNIKTYDICKTDFSDRFDEDAGAAGVKTLIQATLISVAPLIALPTLHEIVKFTGGRV